MSEFKVQCKEQIEVLTVKFEGEILRLQNLLRDKDIQMDNLQAVLQIDKNNFEDQLRRDFEQKALLDQKQFSNAYFLEKEELCMELSLLQDLSKEYDKMKLDTDLKFFMQKWKYYSKI